MSSIIGWFIAYWCRWLPHSAPTGLFKIGEPDENSPVIVTANFSLTLKGSLTPVTQALRKRAGLFWNATGGRCSGQTKREQAAPSVNRKLRKVLVAQT